MKINITKQSGIYTLTSEQILPISLENAWDFFTVPTNLDKITPKEMDAFYTFLEALFFGYFYRWNFLYSLGYLFCLPKCLGI